MRDLNIKKHIKRAIFSILKEQTEEKSKQEKPPEAKPQQEKPPEAKSPEAKPKAKSGGKKIPPGSINIARGAVGRGRFKKFVGEAAARSKKDPKGLMKDLGVKNAQGATDLDKALSVIQTAIFANNIMAESYGGARVMNDQTDAGSIKIVGVTLRKLDSRNGMKFIALTLEGAKNAGILSLNGGLEIGKSDLADISIYSA